MSYKIKLLRGKGVLTEETAKSLEIYWKASVPKGKKDSIYFTYNVTVTRPTAPALTVVLWDGDQIALEDGTVLVHIEDHGEVVIYSDDNDIPISCHSAAKVVFKRRKKTDSI